MSKPIHSERALPKRHLQRLALSIGATMTFGAVFLIAVIVSMGWTANRQAVSDERIKIDNALTRSIAKTLDQQKSVAWWDDAVVNVMDRFDDAFVDANFGIFLTETYGHDEVYILDGRNQPIYAYLEGRRVDAAAYGRRAATLGDLVSDLRDASSHRLAARPDAFADYQANYKLLKGVLEPAKWKGGILLIDGVPCVVAMITIAPNVDMSILKTTPFLLVSVVKIDAAFLKDISRSLLIPDLRLTAADESGGATVSQAFAADDGRPAGFLSWTTGLPGQPVLKVILPLVVMAVLGMGLISAKMLRRLTSATAELFAREVAARYEATHDSLSGLPNRASFIETATRALNARRDGAGGPEVVMGYLDIDRFKDINDTLGHHTGDELIKQFGRRLQEHLGADYFIARFGGDEFALFKAEERADEFERLSGQVAAALAVPLSVFGSDLRVTTSLGLARSPEHGKTTEELLRRADIALYAAKQRGRDQAVSFTAEMGRELNERREIEIDLREAIQQGTLDLAFQPVVSPGAGKVRAVEALLRWSHPVKGPISPATFIPIAEEAGLMLELGEWVLRKAMQSAAEWPGLEVAINLSPAQFRHSDLPSLLQTLITETATDARRVTLEITEGLLLDQSKATRESLEKIRAMGFQIALDDFGTGFSSLKYLIDFKFDKLKIDRSFVAGLTLPGSAQTIVRSVVQLGRALGMVVVAEGVETRYEAIIMQSLGCDDMQGYLFAKPLPAAEVGPFIESFRAIEEGVPQAAGQLLRLGAIEQAG